MLTMMTQSIRSWIKTSSTQWSAPMITVVSSVAWFVQDDTTPKSTDLARDMEAKRTLAAKFGQETPQKRVTITSGFFSLNSIPEAHAWCLRGLQQEQRRQLQDELYISWASLLDLRQSRSKIMKERFNYTHAKKEEESMSELEMARVDMTGPTQLYETIRSTVDIIKLP